MEDFETGFDFPVVVTAVVTGVIPKQEHSDESLDDACREATWTSCVRQLNVILFLS